MQSSLPFSDAIQPSSRSRTYEKPWHCPKDSKTGRRRTYLRIFPLTSQITKKNRKSWYSNFQKIQDLWDFFCDIFEKENPKLVKIKVSKISLQKTNLVEYTENRPNLKEIQKSENVHNHTDAFYMLLVFYSKKLNYSFRLCKTRLGFWPKKCFDILIRKFQDIVKKIIRVRLSRLADNGIESRRRRTVRVLK